MNVYVIGTDGVRSKARAEALASKLGAKILLFDAGVNDLEAALYCLSTAPTGPVLILRDGVTPILEGKALTDAIQRAEKESGDFSVCYLHRWQDRCDLAEPQGFVTRTSHAHGSDALLFSERGRVALLADPHLRRCFPEQTAAVDGDNVLSFSWGQWVSRPDCEKLAAPTVDPIAGQQNDFILTTPLDAVLVQAAKNPSWVATAVTLFAFDPETAQTYDEYVKTHECLRVVVPRVSLAAAVADKFGTLTKDNEVLTWVVIVFAIVIVLLFIAIFVLWRKLRMSRSS